MNEARTKVALGELMGTDHQKDHLEMWEGYRGGQSNWGGDGWPEVLKEKKEVTPGLERISS